MKKILCLLLIAAVFCGTLAGCQTGNASEQTTGETTQAIEEDGIVDKVLVIGHSLGLDSSYYFPFVYKEETGKDIIVGSLYHSGCRLSQHAKFLQGNERQYAYYEMDTSVDTAWKRADCNGAFTNYNPGMGNDAYIEDGSIAQTMEFAIMRQDWDLIVLQAGTFEAAGRPIPTDLLNVNNIKVITDYVLEKDVQPGTKPQFAWNMIWTHPDDDSMLSDSRKNTLYQNFSGSVELYETMMKTAEEVILPSFEFDYVLPVGTAMQNANSSYLEAKDLYRDTIHGTDFSRMMAAYTWYCSIFDADITQCKFFTVPGNLRVEKAYREGNIEFAMTQEQKDILVESVKNALATPFACTPSQYTTAP